MSATYPIANGTIARAIVYCGATAIPRGVGLMIITLTGARITCTNWTAVRIAYWGVTKMTPTPWKLGKTEWDYSTIIVKDDQIIARLGSSDFLNAEADAAFIVRAVNAHEELVKALSGLRDNLRDMAVCNDSVAELAHRLADLADKAIAKAEGR